TAPGPYGFPRSPHTSTCRHTEQREPVVRSPRGLHGYRGWTTRIRPAPARGGRRRLLARRDASTSRDRLTPHDACAHRQSDRIVGAMPTNQGPDFLVESASARGGQPGARETVTRVKRLDVSHDGLAMDDGLGLCVPADDDEVPRLQLRDGVVLDVVS